MELTATSRRAPQRSATSPSSRALSAVAPPVKVSTSASGAQRSTGPPAARSSSREPCRCSTSGSPGGSCAPECPTATVWPASRRCGSADCPTGPVPPTRIARIRSPPRLRVDRRERVVDRRLDLRDRAEVHDREDPVDEAALGQDDGKPQLPLRQPLGQLEQQADADAVDVGGVAQVDDEPEVLVSDDTQE